MLSGLVELAPEFGGMMNLGRVRGFVAEGRNMKQTEALFLDSLKKLLPLAEKHDVVLVVEPVNRYETNFINNLSQCAHLLKKAGSPQVGIMADVFHMNIEDAQIGGAIVECAPMLDSNAWRPDGDTWTSARRSALWNNAGMTVECRWKSCPNPRRTPRPARRRSSRCRW